METCNTINGCTDAGLACVCCLIALTLLVTATGAIFRLRTTRSIVLFLRLAGRATYRGVILRRTAG
jgi:hypothetical protein